MPRSIVQLVQLVTVAALLLVVPTSAWATVVSDWNAAALAEVRNGRLGPPIAARALAIAHTCMYDAWAAYDRYAVGTVLGAQLRRPAAEHTAANKSEAISVAAYRCLLNLFPAGASRLAAVMVAKGYDPADTSTDILTPTGIGNTAAAAVIADRANDGANQYGTVNGGAPYSDYTGYVPGNAPMGFCQPAMPVCPPLDIDDPLRWQPLIGPPPASVTQVYIAPHWTHVRPFALFSSSQFDNFPDLAPPPDILTSASRYKKNAAEILAYSRGLDDAKKLVVEYWADGPASELPPGHWGLFAQFVSQRDDHTIDDDVKMFFAMHNASFDAGIFGWHTKRKYDGTRPITAIRYLYEGKTIKAWGGPGRPIEKIAGEKWSPYNPGSNLSPSFPGYPSGHSVFSSASATVLKLFTGSDDFGFSTVVPADFGRVEPGIPAVPTTVTFQTFTEAAEEAGLSRLLGGIHFSDDVTTGQEVGVLIGLQAWIKANMYFYGIMP
jgi:hypothetical protein